MSASEPHSAATLKAVGRIQSIRLGRHELPWWAVILGVFVVSRLVTTAFMVMLFLVFTSEHWAFAGTHAAAQNFFTFSGSWDASFYRRIAADGYPSTLPVDDSGDVLPNSWAFLPVFPAVTRAVMFLGLDFNAAGVVVATVCGAAAALVLYRLVAEKLGVSGGLWSVLLFVFGPLSFVLQVAYAESLFCLLIFAALWAMQSRRYWLVIPLGVLAAFTRPGALALSLALAIVWVLRMRAKRHRAVPFPLAEQCALLAAAAIIALAGLAWPLIADGVTGHPGAYLATELSWWTGYVGRVSFVPLTPWFIFATRYLGILGIVVVLAVGVGFVWMLRRPSIRALGQVTLAFSVSYSLYLFAVFLPQQSLFRLLMPLAPLGGAVGASEHRRLRVPLLVAAIALQPVALLLLWTIGYP